MRRAILGLVISAAVAACGTKAPSPPATPDTPAAVTPSIDAGAPPVADQAPVDAGSSTNTASSSAAAAPAAANDPPEPPDVCAPVALAYEKSLRTKLRQCWLDAANKSNERIVGSVKLILEIDNSGKIVGQRFAEKSDLPQPIQKCMMRVFKAEPIDGKKCDMKTFTIAEKFPR